MAVALLEIGKHAALDGVTALSAAGLRNYQEPLIHVSVPRGTRPGNHAGVRVHETRRRLDTDVIDSGIRRVRPAEPPCVPRCGPKATGRPPS